MYGHSVISVFAEKQLQTGQLTGSISMENLWDKSEFINIVFSCGATQYMVLCVRMSFLLVSGPQIYKIIFTKPMPRQIYCWQCCGLVCLLHVVVWNPPFISKDYVTVIEGDCTGTTHKMPVGLSVHESYTPQLQRPESSF